MNAACGCRLVQCDPCGRMVPRGEVLNLSAEESGAAQCDTTACAKCRGADPQDVHPTCDVCGSCDACAHDTMPAPPPDFDDDDGLECDECGCCPCECCEECGGGGAIQTDAGSYFGPPNERPCRSCGETGRVQS